MMTTERTRPAGAPSNDAILDRHKWLVEEVGLTYVLQDKSYYYLGELIITANTVMSAPNETKLRCAILAMVAEWRQK